MSLRVIAGSAKGRRLRLVPGNITRPVMDRVKEALFSIIGRNILNAAFLDLFAGTGSVGIEALSRGAKEAMFVEIDRLATKTIQENLAATKLSHKGVIRRSDVFKLLKQAPNQVFDYIYIAPPQYQGLWLRALQTLDDNPAWLTQGTTVIVQIDPSEETPVILKHLETTDQRRYGKTLLWFFAVREGQQNGEASQEKPT